MIAAWRARASALRTDLVLAAFVVGVIAATASIALSVPDGLADAPASVRAQFREGLVTPAVLVAALAGALYAGFDHTLDLARGVVAREAMARRRGVILGARATFAVLGGAVVGLACAGGTVLAAGLSGGGWEIVPQNAARIVATGALAAVWGLAIAVLVRHHLLTLFVVPATLGGALPIAAVAPAIAAWLPLPALAELVGADTALVLGPDHAGADHTAVAAIAVAWVAVAASAAFIRFLARDLT